VQGFFFSGGGFAFFFDCGLRLPAILVTGRSPEVS
jgi:hypothetical protein